VIHSATCLQHGSPKSVDDGRPDPHGIGETAVLHFKKRPGAGGGQHSGAGPPPGTGESQEWAASRYLTPNRIAAAHVLLLDGGARGDRNVNRDSGVDITYIEAMATMHAQPGTFAMFGKCERFLIDRPTTRLAL
jgi:hypothetical protein